MEHGTGTKFENQSVANTVIGASKERQDAMIFGYASEALNNGFFLSCLVSAIISTFIATSWLIRNRSLETILEPRN